MDKVCLCCSPAIFSSIVAICSSLLFLRARGMASSSVIDKVVWPFALGENAISNVAKPTLIFCNAAFSILF